MACLHLPQHTGHAEIVPPRSTATRVAAPQRGLISLGAARREIVVPAVAVRYLGCSTMRFTVAASTFLRVYSSEKYSPLRHISVMSR